MLEMEKTKAMSHVFKFKRLIGEVQKNFGAEKKCTAEESGYKFMRTADTRL